MEAVVLVLLVLVVVPMLISYKLAQTKNRSQLGHVLLALVLGWIGTLITYVHPRLETKQN